MYKSDLVVKTNHLNTVLQNLSLAEIRIIQLAIVDARETNTGLSTDRPLRIDALRYAEVFETTRQNAYMRMKEAESTLFDRRFTYIDDNGNPKKTRWLQEVGYIDDEGAIEIVFTLAVVKGISRIDGAEDFFTSYLLKQTATMQSNYSVRLYELLIQWKTARKTPVFEIENFRGQLGLLENEYSRMYDFKQRVLDLAVKEINEKSDITVSYNQQKKGKNIIGFSFSIKLKPSAVKPVTDSDTSIKLSNSQIKLFSNKLAELNELGSNAPIGKSTAEYAAIIADHLTDPIKQKKYIPYLEKVGYKQEKSKG
uniref:replication initiation protein RepM n=1 Tax=Psychrobacter sp. TaxID=56811 RepID=UPI00159B3FFE|nr:replication initiation protein RepM [Psychrobacter sp.]QJS05116.1 DNA replication protein [Psychrobacter sp.]